MVPIGSLKNPPIVEVVCGFFFDELSGLDPMLVGQFWAGKREAYKKRELRAPVREARGFTLTEGVGPIRCWLVSAGDEFVVQIQPDRFYFNWRRRGDVYPRFGTHEGRAGVLQRALDEFGEFADFCEKELGVRPAPVRSELAKIDDVIFETMDALSADLPIVAAVKPWTKSGAPEINVKIAEQVGDVDVMVTLSNALVTPDLRSAVRVETRAGAPLGDRAPKEAFLALNEVVNGLFASLFSPSAMERFRGQAS